MMYTDSYHGSVHDYDLDHSMPVPEPTMSAEEIDVYIQQKLKALKKIMSIFESEHKVI